ncbi:MAG: PH domain-containing protein [Myxococcota bacterium]
MPIGQLLVIFALAWAPFVLARLVPHTGPPRSAGARTIWRVQQVSRTAVGVGVFALLLSATLLGLGGWLWAQLHHWLRGPETPLGALALGVVALALGALGLLLPIAGRLAWTAILADASGIEARSWLQRRRFAWDDVASLAVDGASVVLAGTGGGQRWRAPGADHAVLVSGIAALEARRAARARGCAWSASPVGRP